MLDRIDNSLSGRLCGRRAQIGGGLLRFFFPADPPVLGEKRERLTDTCGVDAKCKLANVEKRVIELKSLEEYDGRTTTRRKRWLKRRRERSTVTLCFPRPLMLVGINSL